MILKLCVTIAGQPPQNNIYLSNISNFSNIQPNIISVIKGKFCTLIVKSCIGTNDSKTLSIML